MEIDLAWLLVLPMIFALGWVTARYDRGQQRRETRHVSADILQGMSFLLAGEADKATQSLLSAARSAPDDTGLHQAVGNLYRQRGLTDRAIEVHEAALRHPGLSPSARSELLVDLGRDYLAAGLFDRAEDVLIDFLNHSAPSQELANHARRLLLDIAQRTRDWSRAIYWVQQAHQHGADLAPHSFGQLLGHFYCEQAEQALASGDAAAAQQALELARGTNASGPGQRASVLQQRLPSPGAHKDAHQAAMKDAHQDATATPSAGVSACSVCGFRSVQAHWQCPGCHHWDTFRPSRS